MDWLARERKVEDAIDALFDFNFDGKLDPLEECFRDEYVYGTMMEEGFCEEESDEDELDENE